MPRRNALVLAAVAICLYGTSLFLPAFVCANTKSFPGYVVLAIGWTSLLGFDPRWFANVGFVFLIVTAIAGSARRWPLLTYATAALALASLLPAPGCEGIDTPNMSSGLALGGYLWVGALLIACVAQGAWRKAQAAPAQSPHSA